jgi:AcrR family transcriptional regulator
MKNSKTRDKLIQAANGIVLQDGINQLTLEAVAQKAGISKGGLLYHFPSKEALIQGMIEHYLVRFETRLQSHLPAEEARKRGDWLRAYILATFQADDEENAISSSLLAAIAVNPDLLQPMRERYTLWQAHIEADVTDRTTAAIIVMALDGLWVADLLDLSAVDKTNRDQVLTKLLELSQEIT